MFGKVLQLKITSPIVFFLWLQMYLKNLDLLTVTSDSIARAFNRSGATLAIALDISKSFHRVWHADFLCEPKSYKISDRIFVLILSFISNRRLQVVLYGRKCSQEYIQLMLEFLAAPFLVLHLSYYTLRSFLMMLSAILLYMPMMLLLLYFSSSEL